MASPEFEAAIASRRLRLYWRAVDGPDDRRAALASLWEVVCGYQPERPEAGQEETITVIAATSRSDGAWMLGFEYDLDQDVEALVDASQTYRGRAVVAAGLDSARVEAWVLVSG